MGVNSYTNSYLCKNVKCCHVTANIGNPGQTAHTGAGCLGFHCFVRPVCPNIKGKHGSFLLLKFVFYNTQAHMYWYCLVAFQ